MVDVAVAVAAAALEAAVASVVEAVVDAAVGFAMRDLPKKSSVCILFLSFPIIVLHLFLVYFLFGC